MTPHGQLQQPKSVSPCSQKTLFPLTSRANHGHGTPLSHPERGAARDRRRSCVSAVVDADGTEDERGGWDGGSVV